MGKPFVSKWRIFGLMIAALIIITGMAACSNPTNKNENSSEDNIKVKPIPAEALNCKFGSFGTDINYRSRLESAKASGFMWDRPHPGYANWQLIEPSKGDYRWGAADEYVIAAHEKDIQILFTIWPYTNWDQNKGNSDLPWMTNDWGKDRRDFIELANRMGKPCDMEAYRTFLRKLVERYDGDGSDDMPGLKYPVKYWEIGNEPDGETFFQGSTQDYFEILKVSHSTIKEADPDAKVLIAAMPSLYLKNNDWPRRSFGDPEDIFRLGGAEYFDIMNIHTYGKSREIKDILAKYNAGDKPIWITEPNFDYIKKEDVIKQLENEFNNGVERVFDTKLYDVKK